MRCLLLILLLNGCASTGLLRGNGEIAPPPGGYVVYCPQHPDRAECGGMK